MRIIARAPVVIQTSQPKTRGELMFTNSTETFARYNICSDVLLRLVVHFFLDSFALMFIGMPTLTAFCSL